jgi:hypothetical protein
MGEHPRVARRLYGANTLVREFSSPARDESTPKLLFRPFHFYDGASHAMSNDHQDRDVRERIAGFIEADLQAPRKPITHEDAQKLQAATGRLDRLLTEVAQQSRSKQLSEKDLGVLKAAAGRLDQMLGGISGK